MPKKILFLVPYPRGEAPSQRFRFEQYFSILGQRGFQFRIQSFLDSHNWRIFFKSGQPLKKIAALLLGFSKRWIILFQSISYDFVFIHREATPLGPPLMEWLMAKVLHRRIIYDFDDAIWLTDKREESTLFKMVKWRSKVQNICTWSYKVSCGNDYLCAYARQFNEHVYCIPTVIDTESWHNPALIQNQRSRKYITIGWTGSHSTLKYLTLLEPVLAKIEQQYPQVHIVVISDQKPEMNLRSLQFIPWKKNTEADDLMNIDIGIMPLPDDEWAKGKCGFKALQYMSLEIPSIVSPVGVNTKIIDHGVNGFLAATNEEWINALSKLVDDFELRKQLGGQGRAKVISKYSVTSASSSFVSLFD